MSMFEVPQNTLIVNATEVQRDFSRVMEQAAKKNVIIIRNNEPIAALVSVKKLHDLQRQDISPVWPPAVHHFLKQVRKAPPALQKNIVSVSLYGSYARGEATKDSDIDILIVVQKDFPKWNRQLSRWCEEAMAKTDYEDFLVASSMTEQHWNRLKKARALFVQEVERDGIVLWKNY